MKKLFIISFVFFLATGCSSEADTMTPANNSSGSPSGNGGAGGSGGSGGTGSTFDDPDGDGVDSTVEIGENTDPQDPCSYLTTSQDYSLTTPDWKAIDCDGDGVINSDEVDPDGNNQNEGNGTDPLDSCSLNYLKQTVPASAEWNSLNCDNDCFLNGTETSMGTNPTNPNLQNIGAFLSKIYNFRNFEGYSLFENNGIEYAGYRTNAFGAINSYYDYVDDKLERIEFIESDQGLLHTVIFTYNGDQISTINLDGPSLNIEYDNNIITSSGSQPITPPGLFQTRIELDNTTQNVIRVEKYDWDSGSNYDYFVYDNRYDPEGENLIETDVELSRYDSDTGEYEFVESYTRSYEYYENILNPAKEASVKLIIPTLLVNRTDGYWNIGYSYFRELEMTMASTKLISSSTNTSLYSGIYLTDICSDAEGRPRVLYESPNLFGLIFNYTN